MELKLKSNPNLRIYADSGSTSSTVSDNFKQKVNGILISDCPNIDALAIFDSVSGYQCGAGRTKNLHNIRIQLDPIRTGQNYTYFKAGTYDKLCTYTNLGGTALSGYTDNGEVSQRPALVGTWGITDYIDDAMAESLTGTANGKFTSGSPTISSDYRIRWDDIAIQSVDSTKRNYNPAAAIILNERGFGHVYENTEHFSGKWWIRNDEVSGIRDIGSWFKAVTGVEDKKGIVSGNTSTVYHLTNMDVLSGFTGLKSLAPYAFFGNTELTTVRLPPNLESIATLAFSGCSSMTSIGDMPSTLSSIQASAFGDCSKLESEMLGSGVLELEEGAFSGCKKVSFSTLPSNLKYVSNSAFKDCSMVSVSEVPSSVCYIGRDAFNGCSAISKLELKRGRTKTNILSGAFEGTNGDIFIGDLESSWLDEKLKRYYANDKNMSQYTLRTKSWYKKTYGESIPSTYEIQDFLMSDGISNIVPTGVKIDKDTKFVADVSFCMTPVNSGDSVHGSDPEGLVGKVSSGLIATVGGDTLTFRSSSDYDDGSVHSFYIDNKSYSIGMDSVELTSSWTKAEMTGEKQISFFGKDSTSFVGESWMNRVFKNGTLQNDFVPVKRLSDGKLGFYDTKTGGFMTAGDYFTSNSTNVCTKDESSNVFVTEVGDRIIL